MVARWEKGKEEKLDLQNAKRDLHYNAAVQYIVYKQWRLLFDMFTKMTFFLLARASLIFLCVNKYK